LFWKIETIDTSFTLHPHIFKMMKKLFIFLFTVFVIHPSSFAQCWETVSGGYSNMAAIKTDGSLWTCGENYYGEIGDGTTIDKHIPTQVVPGTLWKSVCSSGWSTYAIMLETGTLWAWGFNGNGQLGDGTIINKHIPTQVSAANNWQSISAIGFSVLALKTDGTLWAWGQNFKGQLGDGTTIDKDTPMQIGTDHNWASVCSGDSYSMAIRTDGSLWGWGFNIYGQLGDGTTIDKHVPTQIDSAHNWQYVSAGLNHTVALKTDGTLWVWGQNNYGQLGDGTTIDEDTPIQIGTGHNWSSVSSGYFHSVAILKDGTLWTWGANDRGELGDGTTTANYTPTQVGTDKNWFSTESHSLYTVVLKTDNTLWVWGANGYGELGDGTTIDKLVPSRISCDPTSIEEQHTIVNTISIYPNPAHDMLFINNEQHLPIDRINVLDMMGKIVLSITNPTAINIEPLANGVYVVQIFSAGTPSQYRLVKQ
jgi:alpha-tubulin suppressor-like RCC1 family protein